MRTMLLVLSLAGLTVLASAGDVFAQRGYGGGGKGSPSFSFSVGRGGGSYSPYGNYAHYGNYGNYGNYGGRQYSPFYQGYGYNSFAPSYYYATPSYYYATPSYYYAAPSYSVNPATYYSEPATTQIRPLYTTTPSTARQSAMLTVLVPAAEAEVWFENTATTQQGMERVFQSPPLEANQNFTYTIKARWMDNGQAVNQERRVNVQAGQNITVDFRANTRETVAPPLPRLPNSIPRE